MKTSLCANVQLNRSNFDFNLKSSLTPFFHRALQLIYFFFVYLGHPLFVVYKDDVGMTSQHTQILLSNVENLRQMNLEKVVPKLHSSGLLDDTDKENLLSDTKQASQRVDMLLTEILPRKGPDAFEDFARELEKDYPTMARKLLQDAEIKGKKLYNSLHLINFN